MEKIYKYISRNEIREHNGKYIIYGEFVISNPTQEQLTEAGYKPLVTDEMPIKEGFYYIPYYEELEEVIVKKWEEHVEEIIDEQEENYEL